MSFANDTCPESCVNLVSVAFSLFAVASTDVITGSVKKKKKKKHQHTSILVGGVESVMLMSSVTLSTCTILHWTNKTLGSVFLLCV